MKAQSTTIEDVFQSDVEEPELEPGVNDVSLEAWLSEDESGKTGKVRVASGYLTIAAVTEEELDRIQRSCEKPDPRRGRGAVRFDATLFKQRLAAFSLAKANGVQEGTILARLQGKLSGDVTTIAEAVTKVSGFSEQRVADTDKLLGFSV